MDRIPTDSVVLIPLPDGKEVEMTLKQIIPWRWGGLRSWDNEDHPFESFLHGMDSLHKEMDRLFD